MNPTLEQATPSCTADFVAELKGVTKRYQNLVALDNFDLKVPRGKLLAVLGPNGAGKSTAISLMLGLKQPDSGSVTLFGKPPQQLEPRRLIGVMMQEAALTPEIRVREHIDLYSSYYPSPLSVDEVLTMSHTSSLADRPYGKLSGGQKRQVQFAIAICGRPKLLFLDEPTVGLDIDARTTLWQAVRQLINSGCSIVLTTHYLEEAEALADEVAVISAGCMIASGSVDEIRSLVVRKQISCKSVLSADEIRSWPDIDSVIVEGDRLKISAGAAEGVVRQLLEKDKSLSELEVHRAGLAEAFTELTK